MGKKMETDQFATLMAAVIVALPRDMDAYVAQGWISNPKALRDALCETLMVAPVGKLPPEAKREPVPDELTIGGRIYKVVKWPDPAKMEWRSYQVEEERLAPRGSPELQHVLDHKDDIPYVDAVFLFHDSCGHGIYIFPDPNGAFIRQDPCLAHKVHLKVRALVPKDPLSK